MALVFDEEKFPFDVMCLQTVTFLRKYAGFMDVAMIGWDTMNYVLLTPITAYRAMMLHKSQFVWYRKLFTIFSRYAYCNTLDLYAANPERYG